MNDESAISSLLGSVWLYLLCCLLSYAPVNTWLTLKTVYPNTVSLLIAEPYSMSCSPNSPTPEVS